MAALRSKIRTSRCRNARITTTAPAERQCGQPLCSRWGNIDAAIDADNRPIEYLWLNIFGEFEILAVKVHLPDLKELKFS